MKPPSETRRSFVRLARLCTATLAAGLLLPACATASQNGTRAEERAVRAEERVERAEERAQERVAHEQEREIRRAARSEERAARRNAHKRVDAFGEVSPESGDEPSAKIERGCHVSIQVNSDHITAGETVTLSGTLQCPTGASAADQQIAVYQRQAGSGAGADLAGPSVLGTATTQVDGSYELTSPALYTNTVFKIRVGGHGARAIVKVAPLVTLTASSSSSSSSSSPNAQTSAADSQSRPQARTRATFTGTVSPTAAGARVALQIAYPASGESEHWRVVAFGRVAGNGEYSIAHTFRLPGEAKVRTVVHVGKQNVVGISEPISYAISQPQNSQLTIQTSADPISYGEAVTINGVAAGAANQPVKLLARTQGSAFAVIAEGMTDANGDYTFTEEPLQNTFYRVADATERSTTLLGAVALGLTLTAQPTTAQLGQQLMFSGTLSGASEEQVVDLERGDASGLGFHVVAMATVGAESAYQIPYAFDRAGANVMRVKAPGNGRNEGSASAPFTVTVTG